jgi:hypothetical protein
MLRKLIFVAAVLGVCCGAYAQTDAANYCSASEKGSLLIFPKVEIRWDAGTGAVLQDTFISLANDYTQDVWILAYFVSENCNWVANDFVLTHNEPCYWSAVTGHPKGLSPWTVLGPSYDDPSGSGDLVHRGYIVLWAINPDHQQIRWNHLTGHATIVNYGNGSAWEYNAYTFSALEGENGTTVGDPGIIKLDGIEYDVAFDRLLLDFFGSGSKAFTNDPNNPDPEVTHDTDLTLMIVDMDLRQEPNDPNPYVTKANFLIWDQQERSVGGEHWCITKWDQELLSRLGGSFLVEFLQTDKGRARIDGLASPSVCPGSEERALLGVAAKILAFDTGEIATAGTNLVGTGPEEPATIYYDIPQPPEEKGLIGSWMSHPTRLRR